jgi:hypothetical protein
MAASLVWSSFNAGELSPLIEGRVDLPQYMKGGRICLNMIPTVQGPALRRGGSRFIGHSNQGSSFDPSVILRFSRSQTESYVLEFTDKKLYFFFNGGLVLDAFNNPYFIPTPYAQADLFNADGSPAVVGAESIDVIYLTHPKYPPQVLSFFGATNWTLFPFANVDGPWNDENADLLSTVHVAGTITIGSTVIITASKDIFQAGHVGALFRIHQQDLTSIKPWSPGIKTPVVSVGVQRRSGNITYQCESVDPGVAPFSAAGPPLFVQAGPNTLVHTEGNAWDGDQSTVIDPIGSTSWYSTGMEWSYQDCGYGVVLIQSFSTTKVVTGVVLRQLPQAVVGIPGATNRWEMGAWSTAQGFPAISCFFRQRLTFFGRNLMWASVVGDFTNFADKSFGEVLPDSAITEPFLSDQVNDVACVSPADTLFVGTSGGEFLVAQQSISDPLGPGNIQIPQQSQYGCRAVQPIRVQQYTLFVTKNGRVLRESTFAFNAGPNGSYTSQDVVVLSEHITNGGIIAMAFAKNPFMTIFMVLGNGALISFTYSPEQTVKSWARHDLGSHGKAVAICVVPNGTGDWDDVYVEVARATNDGTGHIQYSIERIEQPYYNLPGDRQQNAFYVDCGLTLNNTINADLTPDPGALVVGSTGVLFQVSTDVFAPTDEGRFIHYDFLGTQVGPDGLEYPLGLKAIAKITQYISPLIVAADIDVAWPSVALIPANAWRMTVTRFAGNPAWNGSTISILADGACQPDQSYTNLDDFVTLQFPASVVQCGIKSPAVFQTMKPEGGDPTGSNMGKLKRNVRYTLRLLNTLGPQVGRDLDSMIEIELREPDVPNDDPPPIFTGDTPRDMFNGEWDREGRVMVTAPQPLPLTLCAIATSFAEEPDG